MVKREGSDETSRDYRAKPPPWKCRLDSATGYQIYRPKCTRLIVACSTLQVVYTSCTCRRLNGSDIAAQQRAVEEQDCPALSRFLRIEIHVAVCCTVTVTIKEQPRSTNRCLCGPKRSFQRVAVRLLTCGRDRSKVGPQLSSDVDARRLPPASAPRWHAARCGPSSSTR